MSILFFQAGARSQDTSLVDRHRLGLQLRLHSSALQVSDELPQRIGSEDLSVLQRRHDVLPAAVREAGDPHIVVRLAEPERRQLLGELGRIADGKLDLGFGILIGDLGHDISVGKELQVSEIINCLLGFSNNLT